MTPRRPLTRQASLGYQVNHLARLLERGLRDRIEPLGVVPGQFAHLLALYETDGLTQVEAWPCPATTDARTSTNVEVKAPVGRTTDAGATVTTSTVSDVARDSGVSASAVRFYETHGLIAAARTPGNQRRFDTDAACRVKVARVAQRIGLTIAEIRALLDTLPADPGPDDWRQLQASLADEATRRITELHAVLDDITSTEKLCEV